MVHNHNIVKVKAIVLTLEGGLFHLTQIPFMSTSARRLPAGEDAHSKTVCMISKQDILRASQAMSERI